jgi:hypothetical protein
MRITEILTESSAVTLKKLYHVGSLNAENKREHSYEGAGLSVSTHPDAWRKIARGHVTGDTYQAVKPNNKFLNANRLSKNDKKEITEWALKNDLIEYVNTYRVSYYDDELASEVYSDYESYKEAEREADDPSDIQTINNGLKPTDKLKTLTRNPKMTVTGVLDYLLPLYAENMDYDGVWWNDMLDIGKYSAPRGVIVPSKIDTWKFIPLENSK